MSSRNARIGILALETRFPRIVGDVGNPASYSFPVRIEIVAGATPERVVLNRAEGLFDAFVQAGQRLVADGVEVIVTTCGFLTLLQNELRSTLPVRVVTSALMQAPLVAASLPNGKIPGIVTASGSSLTPRHLTAAGADPALPIVGVPEEGAFFTTFVRNGSTLDITAARAEVVQAARRLMQENPDVGAIVLECANMGPYAADVRIATGLPVFDMIGLIHWLHDSLSPRVFNERSGS